MNRLLLLAALTTTTVALSGCFGFEAGAGELDFRPGDDFEPTGKTVHLKAAVADLLLHEVYPGFHANLWAFCMTAADPSDEYSVNSVEYFQSVETDGEIDGVGAEFDGKCSVPAPTIRVRQGDLVKVDFTNNHFHSHTIHWHGQYVPWLHDGVPGVTQDSVAPGDPTFNYEFIASRAGTLWYHCHVDTHFHVMQGLYGLFIVEPQNTDNEPEDIDKEFNLVYSTLNRELVQVTPVTAADPHAQHRHKPGECGASGTQGCVNPAADTRADTWLLNGRSAPFSFADRQDSVLVVEEGERVRVRMLNAGETFETIHTHGHDMYVTHRDGNPIPPAARFYVDTLTIGPAERYDVVIEMENPGIWVMHSHVDHHVSNAERNPGGNIGAIAYQSALDQTDGIIRSFEGAEIPGGQAFIVPLDIPGDEKFGRDVKVSNSVGSEAMAVDERWAFPWELPCATRYMRVSIDVDPELAQLAVAPLQNLQFALEDEDGSVVDGSAVTLGDQTFAEFVLDGRFNPVDDQDDKNAAAANRRTMIEDLRAGEYTLVVTGTSVPATLRFTAELDYHADEETLEEEAFFAQLDLAQGSGECSVEARVFDPSA